MARKCPHCGTRNPDDADFCGNCGKAVTGRAPIIGWLRKSSAGRKTTATQEKVMERFGLFGLFIFAVVKFAVFAAISMGALFLMYNTIYSHILYYQLPEVAELLAAQYGFISLGHAVFVVGGGAILGLVFVAAKSWTGIAVGLFTLIIFTAAVVLIVPRMSDISGAAAGSSTISNIMCFLRGGGTACFQATGSEETTSYVYSKSYDTLEITYDEPDIYAGEGFDLEFQVENLNKRTEGASPITFENLMIGTGEDSHVWAYVNRTEGRRVNLNPFIFEAQSIDRCSASEPCDIDPEETIDIYASNFAGGKKNCMSRGYPCSQYPCGEEDCPSSYYNNIPCEDENIEYLEFEIKAKYDYEVTHQRTLVIAETDEDKKMIPTSSVPSAESEKPTDGPLDLVVDFTSPYSLEDRSYVRMSVSVLNGGSGKYKPANGADGKITVKLLGGMPDWITGVEGTGSTACSMSGSTITIGFSQEKFLETKKGFSCKLNVDTAKAEEAIVGYTHMVFSGNFKYSYLEEKTFFGSKAVEVSRANCEY